MFAVAVALLGLLPLQALDMTERLWAPWRLEYVQGGADAGGCVFCDGAAGDDEPTWSCTAASTPTCS